MTPITIPCRIDAKTFRDFALFDTMIRKKHYRSPLIFAGLMTTFAVICYAMNGRAEQAVLIGNVLLGIGLFLPAFYIGNFLYSVRVQAKKQQLTPPRHVYTVSMTDAPDGLTIVTPTGENGTLRVNWDQVYAAYRSKSCIYLFISARQAFLLPDGQANVTPDQLWSFLDKRLPAEKLIDRRK